MRAAVGRRGDAAIRREKGAGLMFYCDVCKTTERDACMCIADGRSQSEIATARENVFSDEEVPVLAGFLGMTAKAVEAVGYMAWMKVNRG